jgi:class 3 adenylate cyclase
MLDLPTGTVTFLFTDIEGSTRRWEHHPEAMLTVLARHDSLLRQIITADGGVVFKMVGDTAYAALPPVYRADFERSVAAARAQLGVKAFAAAWAEGRLMTPEQALAAQGKAMISTPTPARLASAPPMKSPTSPAGLTAR